MHDEALARVRAICLALPETTERQAWGAPTFRVKERLFAHYRDNHHNDGRLALWLAMPPGAQETLIPAAPDRFFIPPYEGRRGWIGMRLDGEPDWEEVGTMVEMAYRTVARKPLLAKLGEE